MFCLISNAINKKFVGKIASYLCIARRSGTASKALHLFSINPLFGRCLVRKNNLWYFLSKLRRARVFILFDCLQSVLDGSCKAEGKATFLFPHLVLPLFI